MDKMEKLWYSLWGRKKKKVVENDDMEESDDKENIDITTTHYQEKKEPEKVIVKSSDISDVKGRVQEVPSDTDQSKWSPGGQVRTGVSTTSLRGSKGMYDRHLWSSNQHFHLPVGTQPRSASSRASLSTGDRTMSRSTQIHPGHHTARYVVEPYSTLKRTLEPGDKNVKSAVQHFHLPNRRTGNRHLYGRPGTRTAMSQLVEQIQGSGTGSSLARARSPSMNNEEPIQLAHYPGGTPKERGEIDEFPDRDIQSWEQERKRRRSGSLGSNEEEEEEDEMVIEEDMEAGEKMRRNEEELQKISSGIGKVFLDTIRKTEQIRSTRITQIDPRSAARTPAANKMPKFRLRYESPAWASPSRDTHHARPWDSEEDLEHQVVLTSSGCASGCTSDLISPASLSRGGPSYRSTSSLGRSSATLNNMVYRSGTIPRPGYTQTARSQTLPHIKSVSGRIVPVDEFEVKPDCDEVEMEPVYNQHSGVVTTVNNNFSWKTIARFHGEDSLKRDPVRSHYFHRPELKHRRTILDQ